MKVKKLYDDGGLRTFAVVMDVGDDGVERLVSFAHDQAVKAASVTAVGACRDATIAYFDPDIKDYRSARIEGQMELLSVVGDIATKDGEPALHVHAVLAGRTSQPSAVTWNTSQSSRPWRSSSRRRRAIWSSGSTM